MNYTQLLFSPINIILYVYLFYMAPKVVYEQARTAS